MRTKDGFCVALCSVMRRSPGIGRGDERLERRVHHLLRAECVLEHMVGGGEAIVGIAVAQVIVERDVGALAALEMLQVGERRRRLQHLVHDRVRVRGLALVEDGGQFLVLGDDEARRMLGDVRVFRQHHRDRLAGEAHLAVGEDRLVVKGRPVIGIGDDGLHVVDGDDAVHAFERSRGAHVDALDPSVRDGAAEDLAVQHAGKLKVMCVFGAARDLGARFEPRQRASDLARRHRRLVHHAGSAAAAFTVRAR